MSGYRTAMVRRTRSGLVYFSGQIAIDARGRVLHPGDVGGQATVVYRQLLDLVRANGGEAADLVQLRTYLVDDEDLDAVLVVRNEILVGASPTATTVRVSGLARPGLLIEAEGVADIARPTSRGGIAPLGA